MVMGLTWATASSFWFWHLPLGLSRVFPFCPFSFLIVIVARLLGCFLCRFFGPSSSGFIVSTGKYKYRIVRLLPSFMLFTGHINSDFLPQPVMYNIRRLLTIVVNVAGSSNEDAKDQPYTLHHFNFDGATYLLLLALMLCWHGHINTYIHTRTHTHTQT